MLIIMLHSCDKNLPIRVSTSKCPPCVFRIVAQITIGLILILKNICFLLLFTDVLGHCRNHSRIERHFDGSWRSVFRGTLNGHLLLPKLEVTVIWQYGKANEPFFGQINVNDDERFIESFLKINVTNKSMLWHILWVHSCGKSTLLVLPCLKMTRHVV